MEKKGLHIIYTNHVIVGVARQLYQALTLQVFVKSMK